MENNGKIILLMLDSKFRNVIRKTEIWGVLH